MLEFLRGLFDANFMPHGHCYYWRPEIVWLHAVSDAMIAASYYSIPLALVYFARRRTDLAFRWMFVLFGLFIVTCGTTHILSILTLWQPVYRFEGLVKLVTAALSVATAVLLWPLIPRALQLPSPADLHLANAELEEKNRRLVESERAKDEFFANVSHELRTPLTLILAPLEGLLAGLDGELQEAQRRRILTMHSSAMRLFHMVTGLLDFSRLEAGRLQANRHGVDVALLTRRIVSDFESAFAAKSIETSLAAPADRLAVELDPYLYDRILSNLLANALKFTPAGGRVSVELEARGERLRLAVADTGIGIPPEDQARIFERFRQLSGSTTRRYEGAGLGLAMVREFAHLLAGEVDVASEPGRGTTFTVDLLAPPAAEVDDSVARPTPMPLPRPVPDVEVVQGEPEPEGLPRVLVAEDNADLAAYIQEILHPYASIRTAADGETARAIAHEWVPDLVLSDLMMPGRDGLDLCRAIRADERTRGICFVLLTALTHREALMSGLEAGADDYLFKPFQPQELIARVRNLLALSRERQVGAALRTRKAVLERSNRELQEFASIIAHDLQEPLRKIQIFGGRLDQRVGAGLDPDSRKDFDRILRSAERLQQMIESLLEYTRIASRARPFERVDLGRSVGQALEELAPRIERAGGRVESDVNASIDADPVQTTQLFRHLIGNAIKFRKPDRPPEIAVRARVEGAECRIEVEDRGIGLEPRFAEQIFQIFTRLHPASHYEGTGMGLAVCRRIAERHGGRIEAHGRPGEGAVFTVHLPLAQRNVEEAG